MAILDRWCRKKIDFRVPTGRTLKQSWKEWRGVAPIWAAICLQTVFSGQVIAPPRAVYEILFDPGRLRTTMAWAVWFRQFATTFQPLHSSGPLIAENEAVDLQFGIEPEAPPFVEIRLEDEDIAAATSGLGGKYLWNSLDRG
jgi:hypothetical protein